MQCIKYSYVLWKRVKFGTKTRTSCEEMGDLSKKVNFNISAPLWDVPSLFGKTLEPTNTVQKET